jgi:hypothetical protein
MTKDTSLGQVKCPRPDLVWPETRIRKLLFSKYLRVPQLNCAGRSGEGQCPRLRPTQHYNSLYVKDLRLVAWFEACLPPSLVWRAAKQGIADAWRFQNKTSIILIMSK